jgi:hypothetical protein
LNDQLKSNGRMRYVDYLSDEHFDATDFYDADHLNHTGAMKFSKILDGVLQDWRD